MREAEEADVLQQRSDPMSGSIGKRSAAPRKETALFLLSEHTPTEPGRSGSPLQIENSYTGQHLLCS